MSKQRVRITIEVDTGLPRDTLNSIVLATARREFTKANDMDCIYCATEVIIPDNYRTGLYDLRAKGR